jgi:hypothetical protein
MSAPTNPFERLGIAPTLDRLRIKRAYFEQLSRTPPHRDPEAFAELRVAYEALMRPGGPEAASLLLPLDPNVDALAYRERYAARIEAARAQLREREAAEAAVKRFVERARSSTLQDWLAPSKRDG